jgi:transposase
VLADAAYDSDALRQTLADRGAWANVKLMPRRRNVPAFSTFLYRYPTWSSASSTSSDTSEPSPRYDKRSENYLAAIKLASARIWMRANESMT